MPADITPLDAFTTPVRKPLAGELVTQASVEQYVQPLADQVNYLRNRSKAVNITDRPIPMSGGQVETTGQWRYFGLTWVQADVSNPHLLRVDFELPPGVTITTIKAYVDGNAGGSSHGALPVTMPEIALNSLDPSTGGASSHGSQTDTSGTVGAYETIHAITLSSLSVTISAARRYYVRISGEGGANSVANALGLYGFLISWTA